MNDDNPLNRSPHLFCLIGEESGDLHAGNVLRRVKEIQPDLKITGTGGDIFNSLSDTTYYHAKDMSVVGFAEVLKKYGYFKGIIEDLCAKIEKERPEFLMLVDYPGMNLRVAERTRHADIKNIYFISPQVWAWHKKRTFKIKRLVDLMIVIFPFEKEFFKSFADMDVDCFGHPFLQEYKRISQIPSPFDTKDRALDIAVLPGSRPGEIKRLMPVLAEAMKHAEKELPHARFWVMKAKQVPAQMLVDAGFKESPAIRLVEGSKKEYIYHSQLAWCCSGTASLECAILKTAPIIFYRSSALNYFIWKMIGAKSLGMPNIVADEQVFTELLQEQMTPNALLKETRRYLNHPEQFSKSGSIFDKIHSRLGADNPDVYQSIAERIAEFIKANPRT